MMTAVRLFAQCTFLGFSEAILVTTGALTWSPCVAAPAVAVAGTNLVAPLAVSSAQLMFNEGQIANNQPLVDTVLPAVPGPVSSWTLSQFNHAVYLRPSNLLTLNVPGSGPVYYATPSDQETMLMIRHVAGEPGFVFTLGNSNGTLTNAGGRSLYLNESALPGVPNTFDREIDLAVDARVAGAFVSYTFPTAKATGAVLAMSYTGVGLMFTDPLTRAQQFVFMQEGITGSGAASASPGFICTGNTVVLYAPSETAAQTLPFETDTGQLHHLTYNLTAAVQAMLSDSTPCGGGTSPWTPAMENLANWQMTGTYIGSETENTDLRPLAATNQPQGSVLLELDIANLSLHRQ